MFEAIGTWFDTIPEEMWGVSNEDKTSKAPGTLTGVTESSELSLSELIRRYGEGSRLPSSATKKLSRVWRCDQHFLTRCQADRKTTKS